MHLNVNGIRPREIVIDGQYADRLVRADGTLLWQSARTAEGAGSSLSCSQVHIPAALREFTIYGKSSQVTLTGKNLLSRSSRLNVQLSAGVYRLVSDTSPALRSSIVDLQQKGRIFRFTVPSWSIYTGGMVYACFCSGYPGVGRVCRGVSVDAAHPVVQASGAESHLVLIERFSAGTMPPNTAMLTAGSAATGYEPYNGGVASPSVLRPQEIDHIENPRVIFTGAAGEERAATLPFTLRGIGEARDTLTIRSDGTGTLVRRVGVIDSYGSEPVGDQWMSTTGTLSQGAGVEYVIAPERVTLSPEAVRGFWQNMELFAPECAVTNDQGCYMTIRYRAEV